ncbi:MAG: hypothetical protein MJ058_02745 [Akkermansia sp.]|nr:hypothetical protein [Akkermansia sp.]
MPVKRSKPRQRHADMKANIRKGGAVARRARNGGSGMIRRGSVCGAVWALPLEKLTLRQKFLQFSYEKDLPT